MSAGSTSPGPEACGHDSRAAHVRVWRGVSMRGAFGSLVHASGAWALSHPASPLLAVLHRHKLAKQHTLAHQDHAQQDHRQDLQYDHHVTPHLTRRAPTPTLVFDVASNLLECIGSRSSQPRVRPPRLHPPLPHAGRYVSVVAPYIAPPPPPGCFCCTLPQMVKAAACPHGRSDLGYACYAGTPRVQRTLGSSRCSYPWRG